MASTQEKIPAVLEELMKELDSVAVQEGDATKEQAVTHGAIANRTKHDLELMFTNAYSGHFEESGPAPVIPAGGITKFVHQGTPPMGSKVGVEYAANGHRWIVAWSVPLQNPLTKPSLNKVYVEDGPAEGPVDWNAIAKKLDAAGEVSESPGAKATITPGSIAKLCVVFNDPAPLN